MEPTEAVATTVARVHAGLRESLSQHQALLASLAERAHALRTLGDRHAAAVADFQTLATALQEKVAAAEAARAAPDDEVERTRAKIKTIGDSSKRFLRAMAAFGRECGRGRVRFVTGSPHVHAPPRSRSPPDISRRPTRKRCNRRSGSSRAPWTPTWCRRRSSTCRSTISWRP